MKKTVPAIPSATGVGRAGRHQNEVLYGGVDRVPHKTVRAGLDQLAILRSTPLHSANACPVRAPRPTPKPPTAEQESSRRPVLPWSFRIRPASPTSPPARIPSPPGLCPSAKTSLAPTSFAPSPAGWAWRMPATTKSSTKAIQSTQQAGQVTTYNGPDYTCHSHHSPLSGLD